MRSNKLVNKGFVASKTPKKSRQCCVCWEGLLLFLHGIRKGEAFCLFIFLMHPLKDVQWHPTPVLLPRKSHGWRSLIGCSPWGHWGSDTTERLPFHFSLSCIGEGNGNPHQCSCLENPRDREPGGLLSMRSHSWTRLKRLSSSSRPHMFVCLFFWRKEPINITYGQKPVWLSGTAGCKKIKNVNISEVAWGKASYVWSNAHPLF